MGYTQGDETRMKMFEKIVEFVGKDWNSIKGEWLKNSIFLIDIKTWPTPIEVFVKYTFDCASLKTNFIFHGITIFSESAWKNCPFHSADPHEAPVYEILPLKRFYVSILGHVLVISN